MPSASSSHRTNPDMLRSKSSDNTLCANGGDGNNGLTQVDTSLPLVTKPTTIGGDQGATDGAQALSCHHAGHFDPYYYVILGSL